MSRQFPLVARAAIPLPDAANVIASVASHLTHHGASIGKGDDGEVVMEYEFCRGILQAGDGMLHLRAEAPDRAFLQEVRSELGEHVEEFARMPAGSIMWTGDDGATDTPPNFRAMTVVNVEDITPHMRRIRLSGEDLTRFSSRLNIHCKLLIPPAGRAPEWPGLDGNGRFRWPEGPGRPAVRKYTIRAIDVDAGWLDIDFVLHDDAGPGSAWAAAARPGDTVGLVGPGGRSAAPAGSYLIAGDETALPAIALLLETLPAATGGIALIEVAGPAEEQRIDNRTNIEIRWLHRNGDAPGMTRLLPDAIEALRAPAPDGDLFAWVSCEFAAFKAIRSHLRTHWKLPKDKHLITAYWRRGMSEDAAGRREAMTQAVAGLGRRFGIAVD